MKTRTILTNLALTLFLLLQTSCESCKSEGDQPSPDSPPTEGKEASKPAVPAQPEKAILYLDISSSMQGYLENSDDSRFTGVISQFLNIPENITVKLYGTGEGQEIKKEEFSKLLNDRKINWQKESNLTDMIRSMVASVSKGQKDVSILITDGILSGSNEQIANSPDRGYNIISREQMKENLEGMLNNAKADSLSAIIVRYKSRFSGWYSCYNNAQLKIVNKDRPFYAVVIGKWASIKYINNELTAKKNDKNSLSTAYDRIVMYGDNQTLSAIQFSPGKELKKDKDSGKLIIKKEYKSQDSMVTLSTDISKLPDYMQSDEYFNENLELRVKYAKEEQAADPNKYEITVTERGDQSLLVLSIASDYVKKSALTIRVKHTLPKWIKELSDDKDLDILSNPSKMDKTFNFKYFAEGFKKLNNGEYILSQTLEFK